MIKDITTTTTCEVELEDRDFIVIIKEDSSCDKITVVDADTDEQIMPDDPLFDRILKELNR